MNLETTASNYQHKPLLLGQTVVVIGGSSGIGLETARQARTEGAEVILTGRDSAKLQRAGSELKALRTAAFDATDVSLLERFFRELPGSVDHLMVTAGQPHYGRLLELDVAQLKRALDEHLMLVVQVARFAATRVKSAGSLLFMSGTGGRRPGLGFGLVPTVTTALPALTASLALELAPIRVNVIAAGFVDTPLSAAILGDQLEVRRKQLRETLPIGRVVQAADVAALALHIMSNTALTGSNFDIDGGQQLIAR